MMNSQIECCSYGNNLKMIRVYIVTGISGFLGRFTAKKIIEDSDDTFVVGLSRHAEEIIDSNITESKRVILRNADVSQADGLKCAVRDIIRNICISDEHGLTECCVNIIHCAATTQSSQMIANPEGTYRDIVEGTRNLLDIAKEIIADGMVFLSSMEAYGDIDAGDCRVTEDMCGYIDSNNPRSCYPLAKIEAERLCIEYAKKGVPVKIARLAQVFGKGVSRVDNRVFAQFAKSVINGDDIVLHTDGLSYGNYCEVSDAVNGIMTILKKGIPGEIYNVVNEDNTMTIKEMAELVASDIAGGEINVIFDIPEGNPHGYASKTGLKMSSEKLQNLDWHPIKNLTDMYIDLIDSLKESI